jgi:hypothetical protein
MKIVDETCEMFGDKCRHCSNDAISVHPFTKLRKNEKTGLFDAIGSGCVRTVYKQRCNNGGGIIEEMRYCPARWALRRNGLVYI